MPAVQLGNRHRQRRRGHRGRGAEQQRLELPVDGEHDDSVSHQRPRRVLMVAVVGRRRRVRPQDDARRVEPDRDPAAPVPAELGVLLVVPRELDRERGQGRGRGVHAVRVHLDVVVVTVLVRCRVCN